MFRMILVAILALTISVFPENSMAQSESDDATPTVQQQLDFLYRALENMSERSPNYFRGTCQNEPIDKCCCKLGSTGFCTTRNECINDFGGSCVTSANGCG